MAQSRRCLSATTLLLTLALTCALLLPPAAARPAQSGLGLEKRVSDQRLAELETLLAMAVNSRRMAEMPVGFGLIDPHAIGRRKRSTHPLSDALLQELARNPTAYNNLLQVLSSYVQQEDQQEAMQMGKLVGGSGEFGGPNGVRGPIMQDAMGEEAYRRIDVCCKDRINIRANQLTSVTLEQLQHLHLLSTALSFGLNFRNGKGFD